MLKSDKIAIENIIKQAENGFIKIGDENFGFWHFYTRFYFQIEGKTNAKNTKYPIINIPNYNTFLNELESYLQTAKKFYANDQNYYMLNNQSFTQKLFLDLVVNATNFDFNNFISHIQTRKKMIENPLKTGVFKLGEYEGLTILGNVVKNPSGLETPYEFEVAFEDQHGNRFKLPSISFGTIDDTCFVMAVQNKADKETNPLRKKLDRYFRKVNKNVDTNEVISNVSPNALVSLTLFNSLIKQSGIKRIVAPNFMPVRYNGNKIAGYIKNTKSVPKETSENLTLVEQIKKYNREKRREFLEKHNKNQFNITNKFTYLFIRYCHHFPACEAIYDDARQSMIVYLSKTNEKVDDNIIYNLDKSVSAKLEFESGLSK